ncbi:Protein of unknown function [Gryllus bimaculatus]|nr:Protein of unknown function [Gryllus bimaculatus]
MRPGRTRKVMWRKLIGLKRRGNLTKKGGYRSRKQGLTSGRNVAGGSVRAPAASSRRRGREEAEEEEVEEETKSGATSVELRVCSRSSDVTRSPK